MVSIALISIKNNQYQLICSRYAKILWNHIVYHQLTQPKYINSRKPFSYILLNAIEKGRKSCPAYEIFVALLFAKDTQEISELKQIAYKASSNDELSRFANTLFVVYETPFGETNYERFIEYQANASVARNYNSNDQAEAHIGSANAMIREWVWNCSAEHLPIT